MPSKVLYSKLFTPPKFLEMTSVCLELNTKGISYLLAKNTDQGLVPDIYGVVLLPAGAIFQGEISKKELVVKALHEIKQKTGVNFVRFSIPEEKTYLFRTSLPNLEPKEIRGVLDFKIEENVPLTSKEAIFDYDVIPCSKHLTRQSLVVSVTALRYVEDWQEVFELAGLTPVFFSPESNNVAHSIIKTANQQVIVVVNIRETYIVFSLVVCGVVCQTASVNFGSAVFNDLLVKYFKATSAEEVQKIKKERLYQVDEQNMEIFSYLINTISAVKDEIYKFVSYCNEREDINGQVDRIILCGQDALIVGFDKYLALNLNLKIEVANVWANNFVFEDYVPVVSKAESMNLAVLNGLSLY